MPSGIVTTTGQSIRIVDVTGGCSAVPLAPINCYSALSVPAYRRAIQFLSDNLASFPRSVRKDGAKSEDTAGHPLNKLLRRRPNDLQSPFTFWRHWFYSAAHTGGGYILIERSGPTFTPVALYNLNPEDVTPFRVNLDGEGWSQWYWHRPSKAAIPSADILYLQGLSHDGMSGMDPVSLHERTFQRATMIERYQTTYLRKGTAIKGSVEIPGHMTPEQFAEFRAVLRTYRGDESEDDILILTDDAKLTNTTISPQQSQLVEQSAATTKAIAQITGVPPEMLYELSEAKYNASVEQQGQNVVRFTFRAWVCQAEQELTLKLLSESEQDDGYTVGINVDSLLRGDTAAVVDAVTKTVNAGLRTRNEGRDLLDLPPDADPESDRLKTLGDTTPAKPAA